MELPDTPREAFYDALTGLPTRQLFTDRVAHALARNRRRPDRRVAVMLIDLDRFAVVNESLGHVAGDELLAAVAARMCEVLRPEDTVARVGGDEFGVLLEDVVDVASAIRVAERLRSALDAPFEFDQWRAYVSASIGITMQLEAGQDAGVLLREAYTAMRHARTEAPGAHRVFHGAMHVQALRQMQLDAELRLALERDEFILHYQPTFSLLTGAVTGFEALLRWQHPELGVLPPDDFIAIAERSSIMDPLAVWVVRAACQQWRDFRENCGAADLRMSVNISPRQLLSDGLVQTVREALGEFGIPGKALRVEITERTLVKEHDAVRTVLQQLAALDVEVALDDFGTGYCSLAYLHSFPIRCLKIDRRFVELIDVEQRDREIVRAVIDLGRNLGMHVVAEGVETTGQLVELIALHCNEAQGFLFARAMPADRACRLLQDERKAHRQLLPTTGLCN